MTTESEETDQKSKTEKEQKIEEAIAKGKITPDLVREIADRVYTMWLKDLQVEHERRQGRVNGWRPR